MCDKCLLKSLKFDIYIIVGSGKSPIFIFRNPWDIQMVRITWYQGVGIQQKNVSWYLIQRHLKVKFTSARIEIIDILKPIISHCWDLLSIMKLIPLHLYLFCSSCLIDRWKRKNNNKQNKKKYFCMESL